MLFVLLYLGFYAFGVVMALAVTLPRQAAISAVTVLSMAGVASGTLWLLVVSGFTEAWLAIAMVGSVTLPAAMIGLGLALGWWVRIAQKRKIATAVAVGLPVSVCVVLLIF